MRLCLVCPILEQTLISTPSAAGPSGGRLVGAARRNPLSMQHLPALAEGSATSVASDSSSPVRDPRSGQHVAEPEGDGWEHILPAASSSPRSQQPGPEQTPTSDRDSSQGQARIESSSGQPGQPGYQQQRSGGGASAAQNGASGMSQEQRGDHAAFVARTNEQLAQAAASPAAASQAQNSSNGAGQQGNSSIEARRRRLLAMRMTELRPLCKEQSIPMHGTKAVIVQRLLDSTQ